MPFTVHSTDYTDADYPPLTAARRIGVHDGDEDDSPSPAFFLGLAWALGISAVIWGSVILAASFMVK